MSRFLAEPITKKESESFLAHDLAIGKSAMQGWRDTMEDVDIVRVPLHESVPDTVLVAVFDGHGGSTISRAVADRIVDHIVGTEDFQNDPKNSMSLAVALAKSFVAIDELLKRDPEFASSSDEVGSTGLVAIITPTDIICANVGDSRCVLSKSNSQEVVQLSVDHKPDVEFEKQRIVAAGGTVFRGRVCGGVAVARSFGDYWFKKNDKLKPHQQLVTAEPCVRMQRRDPTADEFLVLACDGVYDVLSNDQLRKFIRSKLKSGKDAKEICELLVDDCLARGSRDNMSAVLVVFPAGVAIANQKKSRS
ncbi:hypothetical protein P43SY_000058 [Pythium insidiosum]|uniref:PPM-type phosphatase domain-containing protein n=1 Tax=Pythium insidiosum TaxID=114742 RepID=A0AAD5Q788_PYTIN|nr:hypothetical protein P43SY_000058 [Pythium insidiosum]KAJ0400919.1 hypothetical protein ATCC90586_000220 [Pythium insidiosum]